ncbi:hypothetical protein NA898_01780 [Proteus cibi]|uniref:SMI1/KNR4 family protein n=1 Tax=Proteus cibi TaxID=2050966 RepID=A0ABU6EDF8_9GAMM|nr:hypothetical protein [Proteus cibi]MEB6856723.1 hypothetical protein [Proteus cibi]MEB7087283.1 hypothetical protein [Proteus cibi]
MINNNLINKLHSIYPELIIDISYIRGYSDEEISRMERLYDIRIVGQLYDFLKCMGRCSGGFFGDDPLVFYQNQETIRGDILFQIGGRDELASIQRHDLLKQKPFFISVESYTQYLFLLTDSDNPDLIFNYNENDECIEKTNWDLNSYLQHVINVYTRHYPVPPPFDRHGELIII